MRARRLAPLAALLVAALGAAPARADDPDCTSRYSTGSAARAARPAPLRFGIDPELAGSTGATQTASKPEDARRRAAALAALRPAHRALVLRVNRLFWSDGEAGIRRFEALVGADTAAGYDVELQVRYHPPSGHDGDIPGFVAFVRRVVDVFGPNRRVIAMTITNEDNIPVSPNTSDGSFKDATGALVAGVIAAHDEAVRRHFGQLVFGFTYAYRFDPRGDAAFWNAVGAGGPDFRAALGFVGVDAYPGSFYPPVLAPPETPGSALVEALATVRDCWMPKATLGAGVPIWLTENGYPTTPGTHSEAEQAAAVAEMIDAAHGHAATYGLTDYRYFNLRDNDSQGTGMFDTDGVLRDDYSPKPSFAALRDRIVADGVVQAAAPSPPRTVRRAHRRARARARHRVRRRARARRPRFTG